MISSAPSTLQTIASPTRRKIVVRHKTSYQYLSEVFQSKNSAHLLPGHFPEQSLFHHELTLNPSPSELSQHTDYFGNPISLFNIDVAHDQLEVDLTLWIERDQQPFQHADIELAQALSIFRSLPQQLPSDCWAYLPHSKATPHLSKLKSEFEDIFNGETSLIQACRKSMEHVFKSFNFDSQFSTIQTPLSDVFEQRKGVCQDFSHIMLSGFRSLGLPCRYVSGYLETLPPPGKTKLVGADATHAWISVYIPHSGWMDFDPTNNVIPASQHVNLAYGRDYHDISPLKGVFHGGSESQLKVNVDVAECPEQEWEKLKQQIQSTPKVGLGTPPSGLNQSLAQQQPRFSAQEQSQQQSPWGAS